MGVHLAPLIVKKSIQLNYLSNRVIAIDAFNMLYQFLSNIRQADGTPLMDSKGRVTSHLSGLFYRTINLLELNIKPVFVFDGKPPEEKEKEKALREARKQEARKRLEEARARESVEEMAKYAKQTTKLSNEMVEEAKKLILALGLPVVQAKAEGEAQAAYLVAKNQAYAVASQDYDALLYGAPRLVQNLTLARKRKLASGKQVEIQPELIELHDVLKHLDLNHEQFICLGLLIGTDFNPGGIKGIGPKKALQIVKGKTREQVWKEIKEWISKEEWENLFALFDKPSINLKYSIEFKEINKEKINKLLVQEHDFSAERIENALLKLEKAREKQKQQGLSKWI